MEAVCSVANTEADQPSGDGAYTVKQFCDRFGIGPTTLYEELKTGRLVALKCRGRTLIPFDAARAWLNRLPKFSNQAASAA